jgi:phospholipid-transporting ATPase
MIDKLFVLGTDGYAFSQEESGAVGQSQMVRAYDTTRQKPDGL